MKFGKGMGTLGDHIRCLYKVHEAHGSIVWLPILLMRHGRILHESLILHKNDLMIIIIKMKCLLV